MLICVPSYSRQSVPGGQNLHRVGVPRVGPCGHLGRALLSAGHFTPRVLPLMLQKTSDTSSEL